MTYLVVAALLVFAVAAPEPCRGGLLPPELRGLLAKNFTDWKIVTVADLRTDDRTLWEKVWGQECPGIALGHFHSPTQVSFALLLYRYEDGRLAERLLVARRASTGGYRVQNVMLPGQTDVLGVIHKGLPGEYHSWDRSESVKITIDVIVHEVIEAGATAYYWRADGFHSIHISD